MEFTRNLDGRTLVAIAVALLTWSSSYAAIAYCLNSFTPSQIAFARLLIASACFAILWIVRRFKLPSLRDLPQIIILGIIGLSVYHLCLAYSETRIPSGTAAILISLSPGATAILSAIWLKERIGILKAFGFCIALMGAVLVVVTSSHGISFEPAALLVLISVMGLAIYSVGQKRLLARVGTLGVTAAAFFAATVAAAPFGAIALPSAVLIAPISHIIALLWLGIFPTFVGYIAWNMALKRASASQVTSFLYLSPLLAILISWLWLHEMPQRLTLLGGICTMFGVVLVNRRVVRQSPEIKADGLKYSS